MDAHEGGDERARPGGSWAARTTRPMRPRASVCLHVPACASASLHGPHPRASSHGHVACALGASAAGQADGLAHAQPERALHARLGPHRDPRPRRHRPHHAIRGPPRRPPTRMNGWHAAGMLLACWHAAGMLLARRHRPHRGLPRRPPTRPMLRSQCASSMQQCATAGASPRAARVLLPSQRASRVPQRTAHATLHGACA